MLEGEKPVVTTKIQAVQNILQENILNGNLKPGTRLVIRKIAQELGVSEIPVREAIRALEVQGLVTMTPHAGAQVSTLDLEDIQDITEVRSILEGYATRSVIPINDELATQLTQYIELMRNCFGEGKTTEFGLLNRKFHQAIYQNIPNRRLYKMIEQVLHESERTRAVFQLSHNRSGEALKEHEQILQALVKGDGEAVELLTRQHRIRAGKILYECLLQQQNEGADKKK